MAAAPLSNANRPAAVVVVEDAEEEDPEALALELERALEDDSSSALSDAGPGAGAGGGDAEEEGDEEAAAGRKKRARGFVDGAAAAPISIADGDDGSQHHPPPSGQTQTPALIALDAWLPDEVLVRIVGCVGTGPQQLGRVCRRWERARVQVIRERHVATLASKVEGLSERLAREIEAELFASTERRVSSDEYKGVLRKLLFNLREGGSNPSLRAQVLSGYIPPARLVRLSPAEWLSAEARAWQDEAGKAAHKRLSISEEAAQAQAGRVFSRAYQCSRCGQSRCWVRRWRRKPQVDRYRLLIQCAGCGNDWEE